MKLNTRNYQAGIDLGTTNSAIAIIEQNGVKLLETDANEVLLPSCVYFHAKDVYFTGNIAKNQRISNSKNGHKSFKKEMGANTPFPIEVLGSNLLAEELSGIILKKLGEVYLHFVGEPLHTVVVTVPARFDLKATHATQVAAMGNYKLNGYSRIETEKLSRHYASFLKVEILMEPIAASLAYGMSKQKTKNGSWLIFDFGGGTFDAAIVNYVDGHMDVKHNSGNNHLGGDDLDIKILKYIINKLSEKYNLTDFFNEDKPDKYCYIRNRLLDDIEKLKITLTKVDNAPIVMPHNFKDNDGVAVKEDFTITREIFNQQVEPIFQQAIDICLNLFDEHNIKPSDLDKILLVGGPTQIPYFREMIRNQLQIELDTSIDPMTAVATGAALYSQITEIPEETIPEIITLLNQKPTDCRVEIKCDTTTLQDSLWINGSVIPSNHDYQSIDSIIIIRDDKGWQSERINPEKDGLFATEIHLRKMELNIFHITVFGKDGKMFTVTSNEFSILQGAGKITDRTPFSLNITLEGYKCATIIKKDSEYPASNMESFYTTKEIIKGKNTDEGTLYVELTEGESENPDNNTYLGTLKIPNSELNRNLPIDTKLEITISAKSGRTIFAECYIPLTMQIFPGEIRIARTGIGKDKLIADFEALKIEYSKIANDVRNLNESKWNVVFEKQHIDTDINWLEQLIEHDIKEPKIAELTFAHILMKTRNILTETSLKLERFENQFIFDLVNYKIKQIRANLNSTNCSIADKLYEKENQLDYCREQHLPYEAKSINISLRRFEREYLGIDFLFHLQGFILTKQNLFADELNSLQEAIKNADRHDLEISMRSIINDWNYGMERKKGCLLLQRFYNRLQYELQSIVDKTESRETFSIPDYDKIGTIWNRYNDYDLNMLEKIATISNPSKSLLISAIDFCKAYPEGKIDKLENFLTRFTDLYFIDQKIRGNISQSGEDVGPPIRSR